MVMDQRKYQRFPVRFRSSFSSVNTVEGEGTVLDLSIRGCRVSSKTAVSPGTNLVLHLHVSDPAPIRVAAASVRWVRGREFGLEFVDMDNGEWKRLCQVVKDLEQQAVHSTHLPGTPRQ